MRSEKGQSLVEFALVLPLLLTILFGITDFGRIFLDYLTLDHASREGARMASVGGTDSQITSTIDASLAGLDLSKRTITISPSGSRTSGSNVTITITYPIDYITPFIEDILPPFTLTDTTTMRVE